ncbi:MAG: HAD-IIB family hydrolase [Candidatus Omnitrophica bacterium]|nr:HAD-IIB family hydrolase [Candidatus Omnitrophota bacterium]
MYIQLISVHGLIRGSQIEMGRDADTGGQVRYVLELAKTLATFDEVEQVDLFTRQIRDKRVSADYSEEIEELGPKCRLVRLSCGGGTYHRKEKLWPYLDEYVDAMIKFTREAGKTPSLVHGHYADAGYVAREVAGAFGVPFVFTGHSLGRDKLAYLLDEGWTMEKANQEFNIERRIESEEDCLSSADLVVVSTQHERDHQYARYENWQNVNYQVVPPGIELERFFPYYEYDLSYDQVPDRFKQARVRMSHELSRFHFHQDRPLLLALCRPDKRKNIGALIKAYGEDKELQALANLAVFAGIRKDIEALGDSEQAVLTDILLMMDRYDLYGHMAVPKRHDSETEVPELYRIAAASGGVFVNAAFVEPFGLTFLESSATGLPFVGTHNGGPQDIVKNCESGILVNVEDYEEIGAALKKLLTSRDDWETCSTNGINKVREHYTWEAHCNRYIESITDVIGTVEPPYVQTVPRGEPHGKRLSSLSGLLITDIDNTLIGDEESLESLKQVFEENKETLGFGVATGRYLESAVEALHDNGIDRIDTIISSVGTEIYYGMGDFPDKGWASNLRAKWRPDRIREALSNLSFLYLQKDEMTQREFKISYDLDSGITPEEALPLVHHELTRAKANYNLVFSHGTYVDILPSRASKGKAIRYLSTKWKIPMEKVVTAGDSGNDRDMLVGKTAGIVVANRDPELDGLKRTSGRIYFAENGYAGGILEGLKHYGFIKEGVHEEVSA